MSEEAWYKMLAVSFALHILVVGAFSVPLQSKSKKIDLSSSYSVNLVGGVGNLGSGPQKSVAPEVKKTPIKPVPVVKEKKPASTKSKPVPIKNEKNLVSISKKKVPEKATPTQDEMDQLKKKIQNLRKKTDYLDVAKAGGGTGKASGAGGLPLSGDGTGRPLDPMTQKYLMDIWDKIKGAWNVPGMASRKDLETIVTIKIRKDGRIVDINIEKRSGNRVYDESILRVLRAVEPLPPIPQSLNMDSIEVGFRFLPGDIT
ncbi:MAG: hypothetical protein C0399_04010 [Syntrophus sp. (in: bacteria)]|nr:hypothetical protein [Syntrophus sp. (in: bacteria)]